MEVYEQLLTELIDLGRMNRRNIELIAQIGTPASRDSDFDILIIMKIDPKNDHRKYKKFLEEMNGILNKPVFSSIPVFSCYRFRVITEHLNASEKYFLPLHIMTYPNLEQFFQLEKPSIIQSFYPKMRLIFGSSDNFKEKLKALPRLKLSERIIEYKTILNEEYSFFKLNRGRRFPNNHFVHMMKYIVKNVCGDVLVKKGHSVSDAYTFEYILKNYHGLKPHLKTIMTFQKTSHDAELSEDEIERLFSLALTMIQTIKDK